MLNAALTTPMDSAGAVLDRSQALGLVNAYRSTRGSVALVEDAALTAEAQRLAAQYAASGNPPPPPGGVLTMRLSAGYLTFADVFSGWRNSPPDASALATAGARRAGLATAFNGTSSYGAYWVLVLAN